ncbi:MAG: bifunctional cytidylyltransferase/SDR family oxidoreductase, partial [Plesiomonas shigelloides]
SRFGTSTPKQFVRLGGKPVILHTIEKFEKNDNIDEIIIVTNENYINEVEKITNGKNKITHIIPGGDERYLSSWKAIKKIDSHNKGDCNLIFHDAVRPFVSDKIINDCIKSLENNDAIDVVVPPTDTIVVIDDNNTIINIPNRNVLRRGQTPQAFKKNLIKKAYFQFMQKKIKLASDDCGVLLDIYPKQKISIVEGEERNFKITHYQDIFLAENLLRESKSEIAPHKSSIDKLSDKVAIIFGGNSGIGLAIARELKKNGTHVYCFSRANGCDITNINSVKDHLLQVERLHGRIDIIINTAGSLIKKPLIETMQNDVINNIGVNFMGAVNVAREAFSHLVKTQGILLNLSSSSYSRGRNGYTLYSAAKSAIVNLTQGLSDEWEQYNIRVNCIVPERTKTAMRVSNFGHEPDHSLLLPEDVAKVAIEVLCTQYTGQIVHIKKN